MGSDRNTSAWPQVGGLAIALVIGATSVLLHRHAVALAAPAACPGALELIAVGVARLQPTAPLGPRLQEIDIALFAVGLAVFTMLARAMSRSWLIGGSVGLSVALLPALEPRFDALHVAAFAVAAATFFAFQRAATRNADDQRPTTALWPCLGLAATAAVVPPLAAPLALLGGWVGAGGSSSRRPQWTRGAMAAGLTFVLAWLVVATLPAPPPDGGRHTLQACLTPTVLFTSPTGVSTTMRLLVSGGALASALVLLAAFSTRRALLNRRAWPAIAYAVLPLVFSGGPASDPVRVAGPALVAVWLLVALGLRAVLDARQPGVTGQGAAAALLVLTPLLQWSGRAAGAFADAPTAFGHDAVSRADVGAVLERAPDGSVLVAEDALLDALLRSLDGTWQRTGKRIAMTAADPAAIRDRLARVDTHVYAFPAAQRRLQNLGFQLSDVANIPGLAELRANGVCQQLGPSWRGVPEITRAQAFAFMGRSPEEQGPITLYMSFAARPEIHPVNWPSGSSRGFNAQVYATASTEDAERLTRDAGDDQLPSASVPGGQPFVARFEVWRTPTAPDILAIGLGTSPAQVVAHMSPNANPQRLTVCPAAPHDPKPLARLY